MSLPPTVNFSGAGNRDNWTKHGERPSLQDWGNADLIFLTDGAITSGDNTFTSASASFTSLDIGKWIWIEGAAPGGSDLLTTIASFNSSGSVEVSAGASVTVSGAKARYFTDNSSAMVQAAAVAVARGYKLEIPRGAFGISGSFTPVSNLAIVGMGYTHNPDSTAKTCSQLVCCAPVPAINHTDPTFASLSSFSVEKLTIRGTAKSGSKGIYLANPFGFMARDVSFDYFGDQGLHVASGVDALVSHVFGQNQMLVRTGRTAYEGGIDLLIHDLVMDYVLSTVSIGFGAIVSGQIGGGFLAGIAIRGTNGVISKSIGHLSQIGIYFGSLASLNKCVAIRGDLNQGSGLVIDGSRNWFTMYHGHANSLDTDGAHDAVRVVGGGNIFLLPTNSYNGPGATPAFNRVNRVFVTTTPGASAPNQFEFPDNEPGSFVASDAYSFTGQTAQLIVEASNTDFGAHTTLRVRGDVSVKDQHYLITKTAGAADTKVWNLARLNYGGGYNQILESLLSDDGNSETVYRIIDRTGLTVNFIRYQNAELQAFNGIYVTGAPLRVESGQKITFLVTGVDIQGISGSPEGVLTDVGGGLALDGDGKLWIKIAGSGNTGWSPALTRYLPHLTASRFLKLDSGGNVVAAKFDPTVANDIDVSSLTDGQFIKRSGSVLASDKVTLTNSAEIDASGLGANQALSFSGGAVVALSGVSTSGALVTSVGVTTDVINYKDHSSVNQSKTVVVDVTVSDVSVVFTEGIWRS